VRDKEYLVIIFSELNNKQFLLTFNFETVITKLIRIRHLAWLFWNRTSTNVALSVKESTNVALFSWAHSDWLLYSTHAKWAQGPF